MREEATCWLMIHGALMMSERMYGLIMITSTVTKLRGAGREKPASNNGTGYNYACIYQKFVGVASLCYTFEMYLTIKILENGASCNNIHLFVRFCRRLIKTI